MKRYRDLNLQVVGHIISPFHGNQSITSITHRGGWNRGWLRVPLELIPDQPETPEER